MSTVTTNYNFTKADENDFYDVNIVNDNLDKVDKTLIDNTTYQIAGGTATTITLTTPPLVNGYAKTFIASANNVAVATTINGKNLYKPNTTTPPNLIAGKAYTVWYNSTSDCFFIKASAEGNTIASRVLAGDIFSNNDDTGLVGTMPNIGAINITLGVNGTYAIPAGYHNGSGKVTQNITTKVSATYNPSTVDQIIAANQYLSGIQTIAAIKGTTTPADVITGKIFSSGIGIGLTGTMPDNGAVTKTLGINETYAIPKGYHDGTGKVTQNIPNRGEYQYAGGIGSASNYIALRNIPDGYYPASNNGWAPEIRVPITSLASFLGITSNKIVSGNNVCGVDGNATLESLGGHRTKIGTIVEDSQGSITISGFDFTPAFGFLMNINKNNGDSGIGSAGICYEANSDYLSDSTHNIAEVYGYTTNSDSEDWSASIAPKTQATFSGGTWQYTGAYPSSGKEYLYTGNTYFYIFLS